MSSVSRFIAQLLISLRYPLLAVGAVAAIVAFSPSQGLDFDRSIENMFAEDDPLLAPYHKLKRTFGGNEIVMVVYHDEHLLDEDGGGIKRLENLGAEIKKIPYVKDILSLAELDRTLAKSFKTRIFSQDSTVARQTRDVFQAYTHSADGKTASIVCMLEPDENANSRQEPTEEPRDRRRDTIQRLRQVIDELPDEFPEVMLAGEPVMIVDGFRYVEEDGRKLGWASTILLALTIIVCFRSIRWVIIPIAVVQLTLLLTKATLVWGNLRLSMVSSMLTAIVTVVGVAAVVHVIVRYRDARLTAKDPREALTTAAAILVMPVFWACSTDAVGFAALLVTKVGPVQDFGVMMAIGSLLVLASVALIVAGLALVKLPRALAPLDDEPQRAWREQLLDDELDRLVRWVEARPVVVGVVTLALIGTAAAGISRVEVESDFTKNFRQGSPIVRSYNFVETNLGGAGVWDVMLPAPKNLKWKDPKAVLDLERALRLEERLRKEVVLAGPNGEQPGLTKVISISDLVVASCVLADRPIHPDTIKLDFLREPAVSFAMSKMRDVLPVFMDALHGEDPDKPGQHYFRIMLRARERQTSADKRRLIEQVKRICGEEFPPTETSTGAEVTGFFVLLTHLIDSLLDDQWLAFAVASVSIGLMMVVAMVLSDVELAQSITNVRVGSWLLILFRSIVVGAIMLVPNAMPIVMVLGMMGWLSLKINMGAAMIAAVSMGLSVDSSIHYITSFRRARATGKSVTESLAEVQQSVGRAVVFSTLALIVGFSILCTSNFVPTIYFGLLVSLSMLGGLFGNLLVLPLLLRLVTWRNVDGDGEK